MSSGDTGFEASIRKPRDSTDKWRRTVEDFSERRILQWIDIGPDRDTRPLSCNDEVLVRHIPGQLMV